MSTIVCNAVTFNCCLTWLNGAITRACHVADAFYASIAHDQVDVIFLQELVTDFDGVVSRFLHHPYSTRQMSSALYTDNFRLMSSGLCILSRWPIVEQDAYVFRGEAYHAEQIMAKGVLYAKIQISEHVFLHVFNTHLQAWTNEIATDVREHQMREITGFMQRKLLHIDPCRELVIWGADTNADVYEHDRALTKMFETANLSIVMPPHPMFSFDPAANPLGATDDPHEYQLRAGLGPPLASPTQVFPKQLIDFFAVLLSQAQHVVTSDMSVIPIQATSPFLVTLQLNKQVSLRMLSDHFAVRVKFSFCVASMEPGPCRDIFLRARKITKSLHNTPHIGWIVIEAIVFIVCTILIVLLLRRIFSV